MRVDIGGRGAGAEEGRYFESSFRVDEAKEAEEAEDLSLLSAGPVGIIDLDEGIG